MSRSRSFRNDKEAKATYARVVPYRVNTASMTKRYLVDASFPIDPGKSERIPEGNKGCENEPEGGGKQDQETRFLPFDARWSRCSSHEAIVISPTYMLNHQSLDMDRKGRTEATNVADASCVVG